MKHWVDAYPHKVFASVLLLDGKIYGWKIGDRYWDSPYEVRMKINDFDKLDRMRAEHTYWIVYNSKEHNDVYEIHAKEWFKQWEIHEDLPGFKPY